MRTLRMANLIKADAGVVFTRQWTVELILNLAGYTSDRHLADLVALEPSAGDGAFLREMATRLVASCRRHGSDIASAKNAIGAYEIDPETANASRETVRATLVSLDVPPRTATDLANHWIKPLDFLEESLGTAEADFVIGNPPYIRLEAIDSAKAAFYRTSFDTMRGRADIFIAFYQAALQQLRPGGVCAYICADRWLLNDYGAALRNFITTNHYSVRYIVETHDVDAFEQEVDAYPAITVIARDDQGPVTVSKALTGIEEANQSKVSHSIIRARSSAVVHSGRFHTWFRGREPWPCSSPDRLRTLRFLESNCELLESDATGTKIGIGVATGADRVFIAKNPDIEQDRKLPLALGKDLSNGRVKWSGHHLVNPWNAAGLVDLNEYPRLSSYLAPHDEQLRGRSTARTDKPDRFHKTIDRVILPLVQREKLYIADIRNRLMPALDEGLTYPHHNLYWITSDKWDLRVLGALLMSSIGEFFIHSYGVRMRGGYYRFQAQYLRRIRVPRIENLTPDLKATLRKAFDTQNVDLASKAALQAYQLDEIPR